MAKNKFKRINAAKRRMIVALFAACIIIAGALGVAYAQSAVSAFNLNSPASFPVDI